jgi:GNAT superfamily N-acetyltransferase
MSDAAADLLITPVSAEQTKEALKLFQSYGRTNDWEQLFALMLDDRLEEDRLFVAERRKIVVGAVWANVLAGTSGQIMAPVTLPGHEDVQQALLVYALQRLGERGVEFASCVVGISDGRDELFKKSGFAFAANVQSMVCPLSARRNDAAFCENDEIEIKPISDIASLTRLVTETYKGSLDCPIVNDYRKADDLVKMYAELDRSNQEGWFVARHAGQDVGCILVSISEKQAEVVYMGIIPRCRGKELGRRLVQFAHQFAGKNGVDTIVADVDSKNSPAIAMYESLGYLAFDFNRMFVATIPNVSKSSSRRARVERDS